MKLSNRNTMLMITTQLSDKIKEFEMILSITSYNCLHYNELKNIKL